MDKTAEVAQLRLLQQFLQRDRNCLVRLAGGSDIPELFLARVQAEPGFVGSDSSVLVGYADQPAFPTAQDWQRFAGIKWSVLWLRVWRAILLVQLQQDGFIPHLAKKKYAPIRARLAPLPKKREGPWNESQVSVVWGLADELTLLGGDLLCAVDAALRGNGQTLWVVYRDLESIFDSDESTRQEVITGLFELVQTHDAQHLKAIRPLIFLQEALWERLNFENKSHFTGRDLRL